MQLALFLYLTDFIGNVDRVLSFIMVAYPIILLGFGFAWVLTNDGYIEDAHASVVKTQTQVHKKWWVWGLSILLAVAIPTQRTMYLMLGSIYLSESKIPAKVATALELKLDDIIKELKEDGRQKVTKA